MPQDLAIPANSLVLVTGANGLIGSHVADQLLLAGHRVRGAVRNTERNQWLQELFDAAHGPGRFELVRVPDMGAEHAYDDAVKGVSGVAHVASIMPTPDPDPNNTIPTVVNGVLNVLNAAAREPGVRRFVYTSSSAVTPAMSGPPGVPLDVREDTWNDAAVEKAWAPPPYEADRRRFIYSASKTQAEKAVWEWAREHEGGFGVNTVIPPINIGKVLDPKNQGFPSSASYLKDVFDGTMPAKQVETFAQLHWVDVQDTARLHVAALTRPEVVGQRIFAYAGPLDWKIVFQTLKKLFPEKCFSYDIPDVQVNTTIVHPAAKAEKILKDMGRLGWTSLEESVKMNCQPLST